MPAPHFNLARFDLVSIRLAVACAQGGSLTAAARQMHLALAAASRRVRELEDAIGQPLFERHARGLTPTAAGRVVAKHGLALLQTMDQLGGELADLQQGVARHIRLCASTAGLTQFLPPLLTRYSQAHPQVRVDLEELVSDEVVAQLRDGRADVGVFVQGPDTAGLNTRDFRQDELVLVLPAGHALARRRRVRLAEVLDHEFVGTHPGSAINAALARGAAEAGRPLKLRMQVTGFDALCLMVAAGLGLGVMPRGSALIYRSALGLRTLTLAEPWAQRRLMLCVRAQGELPGVARHLVAHLQD